jgi:hypothetical protein
MKTMEKRRGFLRGLVTTVLSIPLLSGIALGEETKEPEVKKKDGDRWKTLPLLPNDGQKILLKLYQPKGVYDNGEAFGGEYIVWAVYHECLDPTVFAGGFDPGENSQCRVWVYPEGEPYPGAHREVRGWISYDEFIQASLEEYKDELKPFLDLSNVI